MNEPAPIELHKALADDTRYRLYRYLRLSGRPVPVRELATRLGLHPNTIRPHLRRLVEAGRGGGGARRRPPPPPPPPPRPRTDTARSREGAQMKGASAELRC
jgi:transposase-like protein